MPCEFQHTPFGLLASLNDSLAWISVLARKVATPLFLSVILLLLLFSWYRETASLDNKGSFRSLVSSLMNTTRSNKMGSFMLLFLMLKPLLCDCTRTLLHTPKTIEMCKKLRLVWFKKLQGVRHIARLKRQRFSAFTSYKTKDLTMKAWVFIFYFIGSVVKIVCFYVLYVKDDRLQKN